MRAMHLRISALLLACAATVTAQHSDYVVLSAVAKDDPFDAAARHLAEHRDGTLLRFDPADLSAIRPKLVAAAPRNVALVMRPEQIDFGFARRFLQLATEIDDDPFVDFAFGYITGATGEEALALAVRGTSREPVKSEPRHAMVAGGVDSSFVGRQPQRLRRDSLEALQLYCAGEKAFPDEGRDREFLAKNLPRLADRDTVTFAGHGYPSEVHGGPDYSDLAGLDLEDAVVLNVACYTGTTHRYFEDDYREGVTRQKTVPFEESFCLALLRTGVVGYTAYVCPRPAGPELSTDLAALVADGLSLGEARRRDYDKTVLGFLGFGEERLSLDPVADGDRIESGRDPVRDMMLEGATGGVLFGDPACVPFAGMPGESPVAIEVDDRGADPVLRAQAALVSLYLHCADPTAKWGDTMAMKVYARVPLGDRLVEDLVVEQLQIGGEDQPSRVLWAVEDDHGDRYLQMKVNFPRAERIRGNLKLVARIATTGDAAKAKRRGGEVQRAPQRSADVQSQEIQPFMLEIAEQRDVSREALQAALDASAALLKGAPATADVVAELAEHESEGFRAVCVLLEAGHAHYRTWQMLEATWRPGDERHLIALASGPELPNFASWSVLHGLGVADTPAVRALLMQRLAEDDDAGLFMSAAQGLALLGAQDAAAPIGDRVLEFREGWSGVEPHLIGALAKIGGVAAVERLEKIASDPRCERWQMALNALARLDADAAARVRSARRGR